MADPNVDLRGTQGAVVLPGGTVVQHYESESPTMNPQTPGDINNRVYDQGRELSEIRARLTALEQMVSQMMTMLQRPAVTITTNQLIVTVGLALLIVTVVLGATYAGR